MILTMNVKVAALAPVIPANAKSNMTSHGGAQVGMTSMHCIEIRHLQAMGVTSLPPDTGASTIMGLRALHPGKG